MSVLQDCYESTDWDMFKQAATNNKHTDVDEYASTVCAFILKCAEDVSATKTVITRANDKS